MSEVGGDHNASSGVLDEADRFRAEVEPVLTELQSALASVLSELPAKLRRASDLSRVLHLDSRLSTQIFKVANAQSVFSAAIHVPGPPSFQRFVSAAIECKARALTVNAVRTAYESFLALVRDRAGDRTTFDSMVQGVTDVDSPEATDPVGTQHRRAVFRGMSHIIGVQAGTQVLCSILNRHDDDGVFDLATIRGFTRLRRLRSGVPLPLMRTKGFRAPISESQVEPGFPFEPMPGTRDIGSGLGVFAPASSDLPTQVRSRRLPRDFVQAELSGSEIGNFGAVDVMFGYIARSFGEPFTGDPPSAVRLHADILLPVELLIHDILVPKGVMSDPLPIVFRLNGFLVSTLLMNARTDS